MATAQDALRVYTDKLGMARDSFNAKMVETQDMPMKQDISEEIMTKLNQALEGKRVQNPSEKEQMRFIQAAEASAQALAATREEKREAYDLGWHADNIPRNPVAESGFCCLMIDEAGSLQVAPTFEATAAINLEYLSIALKCRSQDGKEPLFSLDPVDNRGPKAMKDPAEWMQKKRFEPAWLAGTSVGEVMFQADYHLKELSMGAGEQPVVGMKSAIDIIEREGGDAEMKAREWFVVRKAEIQTSEDGVIIPVVKMGVEAREQRLTSSGLEDASLTEADHPLVQYAEQFTRNFDLIAERKSVINQLRELAKASVMAKFLLESGIHLEESWFNLASDTTYDCPMEVPCASNDAMHLKLKENKVIDQTWHSIFGGVQFGIDRFSLSAPSAAMVTRAGRISAPLGAMSAARVSAPLAAMAHARISAPLGAMSAARVSAPLRAMSAARVSAPIGAMRAARGRPLASMARVSAPIAALSAATARAPLAWGASRLAAARPLTSTMSLAAGLERPQGVDLDLNKFDLSAAHEVEREVSAASWGDVATAFWANLDGEKSEFDAEDRKLLKAIFNPSISDRREDGDLFLPPDASFSNVKRLQSLTKAEDVVRAARKEHFASPEFSLGDAGAHFPISWRSSHELEVSRNIESRPEFVEQGVLAKVAKTTAPVFSRSTEDGMRFKIYRCGSLEVRTTQEHDADELVAAVFSSNLEELTNRIATEVQAQM